MTERAKKRLKVIGKISRFLKASSGKRFVHLLGGAGAGKSWTIAKHLAVKLYREKSVGILATRKTRPAVKSSCYRLLKHWLNAIGGPDSYDDNKSELIVTIKSTGNFIRFDGIDDVEKKKSIEGINYWWSEEDTELTQRERLRMNLSIRAANENGINQIFQTYNPIDPVGNKELKDAGDAIIAAQESGTDTDGALLHVTYLDNPFLSPEERREIEKLSDLDAEYDAIYRLGKWATPTGIIFTNWDIVDEMPDAMTDGGGLDFGFDHPAALIDVVERENEVWLDELIYETKLTNADLMARFVELGLSKGYEIIADCAEPKAIEEIGRAGWNIHPCVKGEDSVRFGLQLMKNKRIHVTRRSESLIKELRGYKNRVNRNGEALDLVPVKRNDHGIDAARYRISRSVEPAVEADWEEIEDVA